MVAAAVKKMKIKTRTMNVPAVAIFVLVVLPNQLVMSGYQQFRTRTVEVNFNGKLSSIHGRLVCF